MAPIYLFHQRGTLDTHKDKTMNDSELQALTEAMETIQAARVAVGAVLSMIDPAKTYGGGELTDKARHLSEIAAEVVRATKQGHPAGCLPHFRAVEREIAVMWSALADVLLRRVTEAKKRNE